MSASHLLSSGAGLPDTTMDYQEPYAGYSAEDRAKIMACARHSYSKSPFGGYLAASPNTFGDYHWSVGSCSADCPVRKPEPEPEIYSIGRSALGAGGEAAEPKKPEGHAAVCGCIWCNPDDSWGARLRPIPFHGDMTKGYAVKRGNQIWYYFPNQWAVIRGVPGPDTAEDDEFFGGGGLCPTFSCAAADDCWCERCGCQAYTAYMGELQEDPVHAKYCKPLELADGAGLPAPEEDYDHAEPYSNYSEEERAQIKVCPTHRYGKNSCGGWLAAQPSMDTKGKPWGICGCPASRAPAAGAGAGANDGAGVGACAGAGAGVGAGAGAGAGAGDVYDEYYADEITEAEQKVRQYNDRIKTLWAKYHASNTVAEKQRIMQEITVLEYEMDAML
jgi:hypothetical protein